MGAASTSDRILSAERAQMLLLILVQPGFAMRRQTRSSRRPAARRSEGRFGAISATLDRELQVAVSDGLSGSDHTQALKTRP
jgi:hypothetical protein